MVLQVFVAKQCWGCQRARAIAAQVRKDCPELTVKVIDVGDKGVEKPPEVFATPTFILNGKVVSLGNPKLETLRKLIEAEERPRL